MFEAPTLLTLTARSMSLRSLSSKLAGKEAKRSRRIGSPKVQEDPFLLFDERREIRSEVTNDPQWLKLGTRLHEEAREVVAISGRAWGWAV
jgi:hypothetical protein